MNIRERVFHALTHHAGLTSLAIDETCVYTAGAVDNPTKRPFMVMRWGIVVPGVGPVSSVPLDLWVYDKDADYNRIDSVIKESRNALLNLVAIGDPGYWFVGVRWTGTSGDLTDETYDAVTKFGSFVITASGL